MTIKNPVEWSGAQLGHAGHALGALGRSLHHIQETIHSPAPAVRRIGIADLRIALAEGFADFQAYRSDVLFLGVVYAVAGLVLARFASAWSCCRCCSPWHRALRWWGRLPPSGFMN